MWRAPGPPAPPARLIDGNVEYQDAVRLVQRLMELGKDFEFVTYPVDQHGWQTRWPGGLAAPAVRLWEGTILKVGRWELK